MGTSFNNIKAIFYDKPILDYYLSFEFIPPELIIKTSSTTNSDIEKVDVYCWGMTFFYLLSKKTITKEKKILPQAYFEYIKQIEQELNNIHIEENEKNIMAWIRKTLLSSLQYDPKMRPSFRDILSSFDLITKDSLPFPLLAIKGIQDLQIITNLIDNVKKQLETVVQELKIVTSNKAEILIKLTQSFQEIAYKIEQDKLKLYADFRMSSSNKASEPKLEHKNQVNLFDTQEVKNAPAIVNVDLSTSEKQLRLLNSQYKFTESCEFYEKYFKETIKSPTDLSKYPKEIFDVLLLACYAYAALSNFSELKLITAIIIDYCMNSNLVNVHLAEALAFKAMSEISNKMEKGRLGKESLELYKKLNVTDEVAGLAYVYAGLCGSTDSEKCKMIEMGIDLIKSINQYSILLVVHYYNLAELSKNVLEQKSLLSKIVSISLKYNVENYYIAMAYLNLGITSDTKEEKIKYFNESIRIYNKCNIENEESALAYFCLGNASDTKEEEEKYYNESLRIYNKCNIENKWTAKSYFNLGFISNKKEEKLKYFNNSIRIFNKCNIEN